MSFHCMHCIILTSEGALCALKKKIPYRSMGFYINPSIMIIIAMGKECLSTNLAS